MYSNSIRSLTLEYISGCYLISIIGMGYLLQLHLPVGLVGHVQTYWPTGK